MRSYKEQHPVMVDNINEAGTRGHLSSRSYRLAKELGAQSLICVPIIYEETSLGILAVDNVKSGRPLTQSDINLLQ